MIPEKNIAVFASGTGYNFISIYNQINEGVINGKIVLLISNNPDCKAVIFAKSNNIEVSIINQEIMSDYNKHEIFLYQVLKKEEIDLIVLAGYLKMIPVKICGITNLDYACFVINKGSSAIGVIFHQASPRYVSPELAAEIVTKMNG